ncbi:cation:proton antiporter [Amycolatopsis lurida]
MRLPEAGFLLHLAAAVAVVLLFAHLARALAKLLRQPPVIGEIVAGLVTGPLIIAVAGRPGFDLVLPGAVSDGLRVAGQAGLALYLVGVAHHLRLGRSGLPKRAVGWTVGGALFPPLLLGAALGGWILLAGGPELRGDASPLALVLMMAVALSVTAVPVLARILTEHSLAETRAGRLSMTTAVIIDGLSWLLLGLAIGVAGGGLAQVGIALAVLVAGLGLALLSRRLLGGWTPARFPRTAALVLAGIALASATALEHWGLTGVIGAVLVGLAIPGGDAWTAIVHHVSRVGRALVPVFFVVAGIDVFTRSSPALHWELIIPAVVLAVAGKLGGGLLGARLGGESKPVATTVGVLLNTRGLTELVVLQAGYSAGILSPAVFLALVVMALATTAMTGPLLLVVRRREFDGAPGSVAAGGAVQ